MRLPSCASTAREAHPVLRRVHLRALGVEQITVFDEEQRLHHHRPHALESFEMSVGVTKGVQRLAAAIEHGQAGVGFFGVGGKPAPRTCPALSDDARV